MNWKNKFKEGKVGQQVRLRRDSDKTEWRIDIDYNAIYKITRWNTSGTDPNGIALDGNWSMSLEFFEEHFIFI